MQPLETKRLKLRLFILDDLDDFYAYAKEPGVGEMAGWKPHQTRDESRRVLESFLAKGDVYALVDKASNRVIGSLGLHARDEKEKNTRELGYVLAKPYWNQGLMTEAVQAAIQHAFDTMKFDALTCGHFIHNEASRRVIEKCGFTYTETSEHDATQLGCVYTSLRYVLTRKDYDKQKVCNRTSE